MIVLLIVKVYMGVIVRYSGIRGVKNSVFRKFEYSVIFMIFIFFLVRMSLCVGRMLRVVFLFGILRKVEGNVLRYVWVSFIVNSVSEGNSVLLSRIVRVLMWIFGVKLVKVLKSIFSRRFLSINFYLIEF